MANEMASSITKEDGYKMNRVAKWLCGGSLIGFALSEVGMATERFTTWQSFGGSLTSLALLTSGIVIDEVARCSQEPSPLPLTLEQRLAAIEVKEVIPRNQPDLNDQQWSAQTMPNDIEQAS